MTAKFEGTERYVATDDLMVAVNAAVTLARPLLVKGEPGTGKTQLAEENRRRARQAAAPLAHQSRPPRRSTACTSTTPSRGCATRSWAKRRCTTSPTTSSRAMWEAFDSDVQAVLLIDEIDKADIEFPNDLLLELDRMEFFVHETRQLIKARHRPIVVITSNNEKELPDVPAALLLPFIRFPDADTMTRIVAVHFPDLKRELLSEALNAFYRVRDVPGLKRKPSTSELSTGQAPARGGRAARGAARRRSAEEPAAAVRRRTAQERAGRTPVRAGDVLQRRQQRAGRCSTASFSHLRDAGIPVTLTEYLALLAALDARVAVEDVDGFYYLARAAGEGREALRPLRPCVCRHFKGVEQALPASRRRSWPTGCARTLERVLTEEEKAKVEALGGWDKLMETLAERLREQRGRHEAAASGSAPAAHHLSATAGSTLKASASAGRAAVAAPSRSGKRRVRNLDDTIELGTRNIKIALRKLRASRGTGRRRSSISRARSTRPRATPGAARSPLRTGTAQRGEGPAVSRRGRLHGEPRAGLRGALLRGTQRVQAPRVLLLPQLSV